jgi:hypothetical protein
MTSVTNCTWWRDARRKAHEINQKCDLGPCVCVLSCKFRRLDATLYKLVYISRKMHFSTAVWTTQFVRRNKEMWWCEAGTTSFVHPVHRVTQIPFLHPVVHESWTRTRPCSNSWQRWPSASDLLLQNAQFKFTSRKHENRLACGPVATLHRVEKYAHFCFVRVKL